MQGKHLFEYAVIRVVPRVERMEFLNAGVILYCPGQGYLDCLCGLDEQKLHVFCPDADPELLREYLAAFQRICRGEAGSGPIGRLAAPERFRWLTAVRSTILQTSPVHPGFCTNPQEDLSRLFRELVL